MSDRQPTPHSGQSRPRMSGGSSVQMEDRNMLRRMEKERRSQEVQPEETQFDRIAPLFNKPYKMEDRNMLRRMEKERRSQEVQPEETQFDRIAPLFNKPYKRIKDDELSSRIQRMLGNYEDGYDGPEDPALPYDRSTQFPQAQSGHTDRSRAASGPASGESWSRFPALSPPVEPLSPLRSSDSDTGPSPERRRPDAPPLNLHSKLAKAKKPTAYVRPMDGPDQVTSASPELKASLESDEHLQDLKESSTPNLAPLQAADVSVTIVSGACVEDILQEMTSWPPLLTTICSPATAEPKVLSTNEETHGLPALEAHESSDKVQLESQGGSSSSSDSDSSSDTDSEKSSSPDEPAAPETIHTQKESDWQLGRWIERRDHQQNPRSPCDVIRPDSHDSSERTEAPGSQTCHSDPADGSKASDLRQTVGSTSMCEDPLLESTSTHRPEHKRKKTAHHTEQKRTPADNNNISKQTHPPLLVKIELSLLSRIPREPKAAAPPTENSRASSRKRAMERDEKSSKKKQKLDKERKRSSSSQQSLHQSEAVGNSDTMMKKKSVKHSPGLPQDRDSAAAPDGQRKTAETHGKKTIKIQKELPEKPPAAGARALLPDRRKLSVEDHLKEAKKLKHKADATTDKMAKALRYLEAALSFTESAVVLQTEPQTPKSAYTMFSETVDLIRFILKLKNYTDPAAAAHERDFCVLCMRCQALLQMAMFRSRREPALRHSQMLTDHFRSWSWSASPSVSPSGSLLVPQPVQQVVAAYISITALLLSAHHIWEQADQIALRGSGLLLELDSAVGPLSLTSSMSALVRYARHGLHWIRRDTQKLR